MLLASSVPSIHWSESLLRIVVAAVLGGAVGLERELREREAGLRTHMLVAVGSSLFTIVSAYGFHAFLASGASVVRADPSRVAAQIVTGIGFLGAGAIIRQGLSVRGLTTAATLWVVAAIGLASGAGYYSAAVMTSAVVLMALWPVRLLAYRIVRRFRPELDRLLVQLPQGESAGPLLAAVEELGARVEAAEIGHDGERRSVALDVALPPGRRLPDVVSRISDVPGVLAVRWMD